MTTFAPAETLIARTVLGADAASVSFASIPATFEHLTLIVMARSNRAAASNDDVNLRFNNDSGANYHYQRLRGRNATASAAIGAGGTELYVGDVPAALGTANRPGSVWVVIPCYARTVFHKVANSVAGSLPDASTERTVEQFGGLWASAVAINRVDVLSVAGQFITGSVFSLYGLRGA